MSRWILFLLSVTLLNAGVFSTNILPESFDAKKFGLRILDQKELSYAEIGGVKFSEISDLAYEKRHHRLFMVSDEGKLFTFRVHLTDKITQLVPLQSAKLLKANGKKFKRWRRDSEGMTLDGKGHLLVSFEEKAKIGWFHKEGVKFGRMIHKYRLPKKLRKIKNFRSKNKSLEALAWHKRYGVLTASEWPLKCDDKKRQTIYALSGREWHFRAEPEGNSAISAIEVMDDGNLLVLERSFTGYMNPFVVTLKKVYLNRCKHGMCTTKVLAKMSSHEGWAVDNFEGLAKVGKDRYLMISDDNNNFFQKTLLLYFEVKER